MWLLIEVDNHLDVGKNEKKRLLIDGEPCICNDHQLETKRITAFGIEVHPMTAEKK